MLKLRCKQRAMQSRRTARKLPGKQSEGLRSCQAVKMTGCQAARLFFFCYREKEPGAKRRELKNWENHTLRPRKRRQRKNQRTKEHRRGKEDKKQRDRKKQRKETKHQDTKKPGQQRRPQLGSTEKDTKTPEQNTKAAEGCAAGTVVHLHPLHQNST